MLKEGVWMHTRGGETTKKQNWEFGRQHYNDYEIMVMWCEFVMEMRGQIQHRKLENYWCGKKRCAKQTWHWISQCNTSCKALSRCLMISLFSFWVFFNKPSKVSKCNNFCFRSFFKLSNSISSSSIYKYVILQLPQRETYWKYKFVQFDQ